MQAISSLSTEYVRVPVSATGYTTTQIKACQVWIAVCLYGSAPSVWYAAEWSPGSTPYAITLIGPGASRPLTADTSYDVWVKITTPAPVLPAVSPPSYTAIIRSGTIRTT